ncbi:MAG: F0F1 ATP synthase subunit delta [Pyrinomonadaceae bacterium]
MKTSKQIKREAKHLFRLCRANGLLDEARVRQVVKSILGSKRRGYLTLAGQFERLVRLEQTKHSAEVASATPLPPDLRQNVQANLTRVYGLGVTISFVQKPELIGGMRVRVGNDVYDGSVKAGLAALERSF